MISIVMPVFNAQDTLTEALDSALVSGVPDQEIILIDDGSTDGSWDLMCQFQSCHKNIILHRLSRNCGGGAARNAGIRLASYPYIFPLDSDDVLIAGALPQALQEMRALGVDGLAAGKSIFFSQSIDKPDRQIVYAPGLRQFEDLLSHLPNPVIGNLLFTRAAFEKAGGYPEHHGFDTQGFGFRLLANNLKIHTSTIPYYYQRLPAKPSYYIREARSGNLNRNWFYIFIECMYKFSPQVRSDILRFPCEDPRQLARGHHLFHVLADRAEAENLFCSEGLVMNRDEAYARFDQKSSPDLQVWCAWMDLRMGNALRAIARLDQVSELPGARRVIYPLLADLLDGKLGDDELADMRYFFGQKKSMRWNLGFYGQKVLNRLGLRSL